MIICELHGGLGNQLLEYAHARKLSLKFNLPLKFDITDITRTVYRLDRYNVCEIVEATPEEIKAYKRVPVRGIVNKIFQRLMHRPLFRNNQFHVDETYFFYDKKKLVNPEHIYLAGYWFDQKYFMEIEKVIRQEFTLHTPLNAENVALKASIENCVSVSLHIRRGDYLTNSYFHHLPLKYYQDSIDYLKKQLNDFTVFVFSDDIEWVRENLKIDLPHHFVNINNTPDTDFMELELMKSCRHNIIANSTFSWWGAWLNENPDKIIIAPRIWWADRDAQVDYEKGRFVPAGWIKL